MGLQDGARVPHECTWRVAGVKPFGERPFPQTEVVMRCTGCRMLHHVLLGGTWNEAELELGTQAAQR